MRNDYLTSHKWTHVRWNTLDTAERRTATAAFITSKSHMIFLSAERSVGCRPRLFAALRTLLQSLCDLSGGSLDVLAERDHLRLLKNPRQLPRGTNDDGNQSVRIALRPKRILDLPSHRVGLCSPRRYQYDHCIGVAQRRADLPRPVLAGKYLTIRVPYLKTGQGKPFPEQLRPLVVNAGVAEEDLHLNHSIAELRLTAQAVGKSPLHHHARKQLKGES